jgi:hypothetical protein
MPFHIAPIIREMENARVTLGLLQNLNSVGYTVRNAAEGVSQPAPSTAPSGGIGNFWFLNQKTTPTL